MAAVGRSILWTTKTTLKGDPNKRLHSDCRRCCCCCYRNTCCGNCATRSFTPTSKRNSQTFNINSDIWPPSATTGPRALSSRAMTRLFIAHGWTISLLSRVPECRSCSTWRNICRNNRPNGGNKIRFFRSIITDANRQHRCSVNTNDTLVNVFHPGMGRGIGKFYLSYRRL